MVTSLDDYKILKLLGKGAYGKVYQVKKVRDPSSEQIYAMKSIKKSKLCAGKTGIHHVKTEKDILVAISQKPNPFLIKLFCSFETKTRLYFVQEFCPGGDLFRLMKIQTLLSEEDAKFYLSEVVIALEYLHHQGIVYRDLKTENVMLDKDGHVNLIDFGLSKIRMFDDRLTKTFCGTLEHMAPEVMLRICGYGKPADWWSFGVFTFELLTGGSPFHSKQDRSVVKGRILRGEYQTPKFLSYEAADFISRLLQRPILNRLGTEGAWDVKKHAFFKDLDWDLVLNKQYKPPFEPFILDETDVQHFDEEFTSTSPRESVSAPHNEHVIEMKLSIVNCESETNKNNLFEGFDYVAEEFIQEEHYVFKTEHLDRAHETLEGNNDICIKISEGDDIKLNCMNDKNNLFKPEMTDWPDSKMCLKKPLTNCMPNLWNSILSSVLFLRYN